MPQRNMQRRAGMEWVMLTVMTTNADAFGLYSTLGYTMDDTSPSACDALDDAGYEILSKKLPERRQDAAGGKGAVGAAVAGGAAAAVGNPGLMAGLRAPMAALAVN